MVIILELEFNCLVEITVYSATIHPFPQVIVAESQTIWKICKNIIAITITLKRFGKPRKCFDSNIQANNPSEILENARKRDSILVKDNGGILNSN